MDTENRILAVLEPLQQERDALETERDRLLDELAQVREALRKVEQILRVVSSDRKSPKMKRNTSANGTVRVSSMSEERQQVALEIVRTMPLITAPDLSEASNGVFSHDQAGKALANLRNSGYLRVAGWHRPPGTKGMGRKKYELTSNG